MERYPVEESRKDLLVVERCGEFDTLPDRRLIALSYQRRNRIDLLLLLLTQRHGDAKCRNSN